MPSVHDRVAEVFREIFDDDEIPIHDEMGAKDVPGWDSLAQVKLVIGLEDEFDIKFETSEVAEMSCIGDLKAALRRRGYFDEAS